jgi:hypothetical protein
MRLDANGHAHAPGGIRTGGRFVQVRRDEPALDLAGMSAVEQRFAALLHEYRDGAVDERATWERTREMVHADLQAQMDEAVCAATAQAIRCTIDVRRSFAETSPIGYLVGRGWRHPCEPDADSSRTRLEDVLVDAGLYEDRGVVLGRRRVSPTHRLGDDDIEPFSAAVLAAGFVGANR